MNEQEFVRIPIQRGWQNISSLYELVTRNGCYIIGGYARFCASINKNVVPAGDIDVYASQEHFFEQMLFELLQEGFVSEKENDVSMTLKHNGTTLKYSGVPTVQLIKPLVKYRLVTVGTIEEILRNFDFTVVRAAIVSPTEILADVDFEEDEKNKRIQIKNIHCPISSMFRCMKYYKKGYWLPPLESVKLFQDWMDRPQSYRDSILEFVQAAANYDEDDERTHLSEERIMELEQMMMID